MSWGSNQSRSGEVSQGESGSQRPVLPWPELRGGGGGSRGSG